MTPLRFITERFPRVVRDLAAETHVEERTGTELLDDALRGMIGELDPYSRYYGPEEVAALHRETSGEFRGIGVIFRPPVLEAQILYPFPGSPAARGGLQVGDRIVAVDGQRVAEMEPGELQRTIQTFEGESLAFQVEGLDGLTRDHAIKPERVVDPTVRHVHMIDPQAKVGYLAVLSFSHRTPMEFDEAVTRLRADGLKTLLIDLRGNPGGILDAAVTMTNRFLPEGIIVKQKSRSEELVTQADPKEALYQGVDLVLLIDGSSASASEVLAGALRDHGLAALVGEPSYGKGTVQTLTTFERERAIVKITTAIYFTPSGQRIERLTEDDHGLAPDLIVEIDDAQRNEIHAFLGSYPPPAAVLPAIRAWETESDLELVPERPDDPQLDAALALARGEEPPASLAQHKPEE